MTEIINKKQKLLLECMIADKEVFLKTYHMVKPEYFDSPLDKVVAVILDYFIKHMDIPNVDIIEAETDICLKEREVERADVSYLLEELEQHCKDAAMSIAILDSVDLVNAGESEKVHELIRQAMLVKLDRSVGLNLIETFVDRATQEDALAEEYSCGIPELDNMIGNLRKAEFGMVYGVTSGGKSIMLANMAIALAAQKLHTLVITLELKEKLYCKRLDAIASNTNLKRHDDNKEFIAEYYDENSSNWGTITVKKLKAGSTASEIEAYVMEYVLTTGVHPDAIIVDYLQLMGNPNIKSTNKFDLDHEKAMGLIRIAEEFDCIVISAGQINRDGYGVVNPSPAHCAGGISVINDSDWSIALVGTEEDMENNQIQVCPLKIRHTARATKNLMLYRNPASLKMTSNPIQAAEGLPKRSLKANSPLSGEKGEKKLKKALNLNKK